MTELIIGIIAAVFASQGFWSWLQYRNRKKSSEAQLMMGIGYTKIIDICEKHIENGCIDAGELKELTDYLYTPYKAMGGNGTVDALMEQVKKLPIHPKEETK